MKPLSQLLITTAALALVGMGVLTSLHGEAPVPDSGMAGITNIAIDNFSFSPATITVPEGTTLTWTNRDDIPHTVVSDDQQKFKSKALDTDEKFSHTFSKAGTYSYFCSIHPKMVAKVIVEAKK